MSGADAWNGVIFLGGLSAKKNGCYVDRQYYNFHLWSRNDVKAWLKVTKIMPKSHVEIISREMIDGWDLVRINFSDLVDIGFEPF